MAAESQTIRIASGDECLNIAYRDALQFNNGSARFGVAVAFRMLQAVAGPLSAEWLWNRQDLFIVSGHPGPGVRDCIEYVTGCVTRGRYALLPDLVDGQCSRAMQFRWEVADGAQVATVRLCDGLVPPEFFELLGRRGTSAERLDDELRLNALKHDLADGVWARPLSALFDLQTDVAEAAIHA